MVALAGGLGVFGLAAEGTTATTPAVAPAQNVAVHSQPDS
jgi:hypothetical protein